MPFVTPPPTKLLPELTVDGFSVPVASLLRLDQDDLEGGYQIQASWFATCSYQESKLEVQVSRQERHIKELEASHYKELVGGYTKKPSEAAIKALITISEPVRRAYQKLYDLQDELAKWTAVRQALAQKKDMLVNFGASARLDKKSGLAGG